MLYGKIERISEKLHKIRIYLATQSCLYFKPENVYYKSHESVLHLPHHSIKCKYSFNKFHLQSNQEYATTQKLIYRLVQTLNFMQKKKNLPTQNAKIANQVKSAQTASHHVLSSNVVCCTTCSHFVASLFLKHLHT